MPTLDPLQDSFLENHSSVPPTPEQIVYVAFAFALV